MYREGALLDGPPPPGSAAPHRTVRVMGALGSDDEVRPGAEIPASTPLLVHTLSAVVSAARGPSGR
jgi:hypothetical protein